MSLEVWSRVNIGVEVDPRSSISVSPGIVNLRRLGKDRSESYSPMISVPQANTSSSRSTKKRRVWSFLTQTQKREEQELTRKESNLPDVSIIDLIRRPPPPRRLNPHSRPMSNRKYFTLSHFSSAVQPSECPIAPFTVKYSILHRLD